MCFKTQCLRQVHSLIQPFVIRSVPQAALHCFLTFSFVHSTSLSTPQLKPCLCSTSQIPPNSIPGFGNLPIHFNLKLHSNSLKPTKILLSASQCVRQIPQTPPFHPPLLFRSTKSMHFLFPNPQFIQCFIFPEVLSTPI